MFKEIRILCREARLALATSQAALNSVKELKSLNAEQSAKVRAAFQLLEASHRKLEAYPTNFWKRIIRWLFASSLMKKVDFQIQVLNPFNVAATKEEIAALLQEVAVREKQLEGLHQLRKQLEQLIQEAAEIDWSQVPPEEKLKLDEPIEKLKRDLQTLEDGLAGFEQLQVRLERLAAALQ